VADWQVDLAQARTRKLRVQAPVGAPSIGGGRLGAYTLTQLGRMVRRRSCGGRLRGDGKVQRAAVRDLAKGFEAT